MAAHESGGDAKENGIHDTSREQRPKTSLACISDITGRLMEDGYSALGLDIGNKPKRYLAFGMFFYLLFLPGLFMIKGDQRLLFVHLNTDFFEQFAFKDSQYYKDYAHATALFPEARHNVLLFTSNEESLISMDVYDAAVKIEHEVLAQVVEYGGRRYGYKDLCHRTHAGGPCSRSSLVSLLVPDPAVLDGFARATPADAARGLVEAVHPFSRFQLQLLAGSSAVPFPGIAANATQLGKWLAGTKSCISTFPLRPGVASKQFELKVARILEDFNRRKAGPLRLTGYLEATMGAESVKVLTSVLWLEGLAILLMMAYAVVFLATQTRLPGQSQVLVVAFSAALPALSSIAGIGSLGYTGLPLSILGLTAPFLVLAQGVDALFILVSALRSVGPEVDTPTAISQAVAKGGAAITIAAFTSVCAFGAAWLSTLGFVGVSAFNYLLAASIALSNFGMLVIAPSLLALGERRMRNGRMDLLPWRPQPKSAGPLAEALQELDPGPPLLMFVAHTYAPWPERSRIFVGMGILVFVLLVAAGAVGFSRTGSGMPDVHFFKDSSYAQGFMAEIESQFGGAATVKMGLLLERPALHNLTYRASLLGLLAGLNASPDVVVVDCSALYSPKPQFVNGHGHCSAFVRQPLDPVARAAQAGELRALVAGAGIPALIYHKSFPLHVHRMESVRHATLQTVGWALIAVFGALLLTMPVHMAVVAIANVFCILLTFFGFMGFAGVTFCANTFVACVMAVGFCVEYTCHVVHAARRSGRSDEPWASRIRCSLETCGYAVLHGCATAMLGVALLALAGSVAFRVCTVSILMITSISGVYALVTLPALLSVATLFSGPVCHCERAPIAASSPGASGSPVSERHV